MTRPLIGRRPDVRIVSTPAIGALPVDVSSIDVSSIDGVVARPGEPAFRMDGATLPRRITPPCGERPRPSHRPGAEPGGVSAVPGIDRAAVAALLGAPPFGGAASARIVHAARWRARPAVVACVPAKDESERIVASLEALRRSLAGVEGTSAILVLVNNTADDTAVRAARWAAGTDAPVLVVEARLAAAIADAGHARRLALDLGALLAAPDALLLSTDADTRVAADWAGRLVGHLRAGAAAAAGMIDVEPDEFAALPARVREVEAVERALFAEHARTWRLLVPDAPQALALRVGGASLAVRARSYCRVGRLPPLAASEDRAMIAAMLRHDQRVAFDTDALIRTSCRLSARVEDGMAGMLRGRMACEDPLCDQDLYRAERFAWLCLAWRHLRDGHAGTADRRNAPPIARALGIAERVLEPQSGTTRGAAWERLLRAKGEEPRLRSSAVREELPRARALRRALARIASASIDACAEVLVDRQTAARGREDRE